MSDQRGNYNPGGQRRPNPGYGQNGYQNGNPGQGYSQQGNGQASINNPWGQGGLKSPNGPMGMGMGPNPWTDYEIVKKKKHGKVCATLLKIGEVVTFARNLIFNIIFILILLTIFGGLVALQSFKDSFGVSTVDINGLNNKALKAEVVYFDLSGPISQAPFSSGRFETLQRDLELALYGTQRHELLAIENALKLVGTDSSIKKVIISVDGMQPISLSVAERIGKAIDAAKDDTIDPKTNAPKREVVVVGINFSQAAYAMAAHADKIILDPLGEVDFKGVSLSSLYFKDALDYANITPYIFRAGRYKSAVEPFMLNAMSPDVRREYNALAFKSWDIYKKAITIRKALKTNNVLPDANTYVGWVNQFGGDRSALQKAQGVVDEVMPLETYYQSLTSEVNADADAPFRPAIITYQDYLTRYYVRTTGNNNVGALSSIDINPALEKAGKEPTGTSDTQMADASAISAATATKALASGDVTTLASAALGSKSLGSSSSTNVIAPVAANAATAATAANTTAANATNATAATAGSAGASGNSAAFNLSAAEDSTLGGARSRDIKQAKPDISSNRPAIAVIYGIGEIVDNAEAPTDFTYDNIVPQIEEAQTNKDIAGVVLYLDSPGGSVLTSEKIRRAIELYKSSGKPLVVSMNGTAASGAYWIASEGDAIYATPSTLTGSIGVFGVGMGFHKLLNKFGAYQDGVSTNELALTPLGKEMPLSQQNLLQMSVMKNYKDFIELVSKNRNLKPNEYEIYAEGQVFLADDARTVGLVDRIGDLDDAIDDAAMMVGLDRKRVRVVHMPPGTSRDMGGLESLFFSAANAYLPKELTYTLLEMRKQSRLLNPDNSKAILAISPIAGPKL